MEHANKALLMVGGMLFALMVMSLVAFVFSSLTTLPTEEDYRVEATQIAAFNNEYTAYDKKIMYGVDVISVLNKALSNNDKYVLEKFVTGGGYNTDFVIDIQVTLKAGKPLQESIAISHVQQTANRVSEVPYTNGDGPRSATGFYSMIGTLPGAPKFFTPPSSTYQSIIYNGTNNPWNSTSKFVTNTAIDTRVQGGIAYHLLGHDGETPDVVNDSVSEKNRQLEVTDNTLKQLLSQSTVMTQTIKNRNGSTFAPEGWSQATWKPAIYDLKTRRFRCKSDETIISDKTGKIIKMVFEEI